MTDEEILRQVVSDLHENMKNYEYSFNSPDAHAQLSDQIAEILRDNSIQVGLPCEPKVTVTEDPTHHGTVKIHIDLSDNPEYLSMVDDAIRRDASYGKWESVREHIKAALYSNRRRCD